MSVAGVYRRHAGAEPVLVHAWEDEETELADVAALLGLGEPGDDGAVLRLSRHELRLLEVAAHAQSFDHPDAFIRMCLAIAAEEPAPEADHLELLSIG